MKTVLALLLLAVVVSGCSAPSEGRLGDAEAAEDPGAAVPESVGVGRSDRIPSALSDLWRDSMAGWSVVARALSRNVTRDWRRIEELFE
jgi:hypothetical protein